MRAPRPPLGETAPEESELPSRTQMRKERIAAEEGLMKLAEALVSCGDTVLGRLELPEETMDAVRNTQRARPGAARNRALRLVRAVLRDADEDLQRRLDAVHGAVGRRRKSDG